MGPKTQALVYRIRELEALLRGHGEETCAKQLDGIVSQLIEGRLSGLTALQTELDAGALATLRLAPEHGHVIRSSDTEMVNGWIAAHRDRIARLVEEIRDEAVILPASTG